MKREAFRKRIYSVSSFRQALDDVFAHLPSLRSAARSGRVSRAFAERIMLAVTAVNGCRYCAYGHSRAALAAGVARDEIEKLLDGELATSPPEEAVALAFAQHYAETGGEVDPVAWQRLVGEYGEQKALDVLAYIRMITVGNLWGNTFDALLSRLTWRPTAPGSSLAQELTVVAGSLLLVPAGFVRYKWSQRGLGATRKTAA